MSETTQGDILTPWLVQRYLELKIFMITYASFIWVPLLILIGLYWGKPHLQRFFDRRRREKLGGGWLPDKDKALVDQDQRLALSRQRLMERVESTSEERLLKIRQQEAERRAEELRRLKEREQLQKMTLKRSNFDHMGPSAGVSTYRPSSARQQRRGG